MPPGIKAANIVHAAGGSSPGNLPDDTIAVALQAPPAELAELERKLKKCGTPHHAQRESDAPYSGELMAIGIAPCARLTVRRLVSSFGLVR